jgi:hypothetical protein
MTLALEKRVKKARKAKKVAAAPATQTDTHTPTKDA